MVIKDILKYFSKYIFVCIYSIGSFTVSAQVIPDTVHINEVIIKPERSSRENIRDIDLSLINNSKKENFADVLSSNSLIFIKSYGLGGISTTSIRGTGANHTMITWNDININSPMSGQSDLSIIPICFIDNIQLSYGGSSMQYNSGGIGGTINLQTNPLMKKETALIFNPSFGSFGRYNGSLQATAGNESFQTVTKIYIESFRNDYRYLNNTGPDSYYEKRKNSEINQQGYLQELYFRGNNSITSARFWYQSAKRNLPSPIIEPQNGTSEKQFDESFRSMVNYNTVNSAVTYSLTGAFLINKLNYTDAGSSIDSRNLAEKLVIKSGLQSITKNLILKSFIQNELTYIKSNNYSNLPVTNIANLTTSVESTFEKRMNYKFLVREILNKDIFLIPDVSAAVEYKITKSGSNILKGNISRNSKVPDMNDLYWLPGGNPELHNEYALSSELSYALDIEFGSPLSLQFDVSFYENLIRDMIQWHPGDHAYWIAENIGKVNTSGTEANLTLKWHFNNLTASTDFRYAYTSAISKKDQNKNQLVYIPENQFNSTSTVSFKKFTGTWVIDYTGRRYITADNSKYLDGFIINSLSAGYKINMKGNSADLHFNIDNLFDNDYQLIAWYPMPGRYYTFGIMLKFKII